MTSDADTLREGPTIAGAVRSLWTLISPDAFEARPPTHRALPYRDERAGRGTPPHADVYLPDGPGPHPSVFLVHGGGFVVGNRGMKPIRFLGAELTRAGWAVCAPSYRRVFRGGRLAEMVDDVVTAATWWSAQAPSMALDPDRVVLAGISAGGTLSQLAARELPEGTFAHWVGIFGLYDFAGWNGLLADLVGPMLLRTTDPGEIAALSPVRREPLPIPTTLLHGTHDSMVPFEQAERLHARREAAGLASQLLTYEQAEHAFFNDARSDVCQRALGDLLGVLRTL